MLASKSTANESGICRLSDDRSQWRVVVETWAERDGYQFTGAFSMHMPAPLHVALDNFSENEHVPFVHTRLGWNESQLQSIEFDAENHDDRTVVKYRAEQRWTPLLYLFGLAPKDRYHNEWVTRFDPPNAIFSFHWQDPRTSALRPFQDLRLQDGVVLDQRKASLDLEPGLALARQVVEETGLFHGGDEGVRRAFQVAPCDGQWQVHSTRTL